MDTGWKEFEYIPTMKVKDEHMQSTAIKQVQDPELYLAADVEMMAKGGWKRTIKCSVRVFDGNEATLYEKMEHLLENGLAIATQAIEDDFQASMNRTKETTNE